MNHHQARAHITASVAAAAWRENLEGIRDRATITENTITTSTPSGGQLTFTAGFGVFNQITPYGPITHNGHAVTEPDALLRLLTPDADTTELTDAVSGLALALHRHKQITNDHRTAAQHANATTSIELARHLHLNEHNHLACRHLEPLAVTGHHLHPAARTRLGWNHQDRLAHDLESHGTTGIRFLSVNRQTVITTSDDHGRDIDTLIASWHQPLENHLAPNRVLIPLHPWQHRHVTHGPLRHLLHTGDIREIPGLQLAADPTASIRTLVTTTGHYLKCSLDIHITSTRRGISPATAANGPVLSHTIKDLINKDQLLTPHIAVLPETAAVSLPHGHPASRDLTCILREPLAHHLLDHELAIPATALCARSPISGRHLASELADAYTGTPSEFLTTYATNLLTTTIRLAALYGVGMEAHLQNCVPTFNGATPHRIVLRDLGGARIHLPTLNDTGHHPHLHPASVVTTDDITTVHTKVAYTVLQNHLAAIVSAMEADHLLTHTTAWKLISGIVAELDIPNTTRDFYTAPTLPLKALLHMRLTDGPDQHVPVDNPLHQPS